MEQTTCKAAGVACTAALLTSPGRAAVATIAVWGPDALRIVGALFQPASGRPLAERAPGAIAVGRWPAGPSSDAPGEELVVCRRADDELEIHCHGGVAAAESILLSLESRGFSRGHWTEWVGRQEAAPFARAARIALAGARTERTAKILLDQYRGALQRQWEQTIGWLDQNRLQEARASLAELDNNARLGVRLTGGWRIVLTGRPNVGKSTLLNALLGFERAIAHETPGTTRDVVTADSAIDGWPVEFCDTAGLRTTSDSLESAGIGRAVARIAQADLAVVVHDATSPAAGDEPFTVGCPAKLVVYNKCDLLAQRPHVEANPAEETVYVSGKTGEGMETLIAAMAARLAPTPPSNGAAVPFTEAQATAVKQALQALERGDLQGARSLLVEQLGPDDYDRKGGAGEARGGI